jgi:tRNA nucleotidyltransferase (CCA-adding enzyme)
VALTDIYGAFGPATYEANTLLTHAGGRVFVVGGAIRDALRGKKPKDIDLMVTGLPGEEVERALSGSGRVNLTGKDFGVYRFKVGNDEVEIALPRTERSTGAGHRDFDVSADHTLSPEEDLARRDFTANAMALDIATGQLIDPFGGQGHLRDGKLQMVHRDAFKDDPLRVLRALVAYSKHQLSPSQETMDEMAAHASSVRNLPAERIQAELDKLFASPDPAGALELAQKTGVLQYVLPEISSTFGFDQNNPHHDLPVGEHTMNVLRHMQTISDDPDLRLAAAFHDIGKPDSYSENLDQSKRWTDGEGNERTRGNFYRRQLPNGQYVGQDHEIVGADYAEQAMKRLKYPNNRIRRVKELVQNHMFPYLENERQTRRWINQLSDPTLPEWGPQMAHDLLRLRESDAHGKQSRQMNPDEQQLLDKNRQYLQNVLDQQQAFGLKDLAINGRDLVELGITPGPEMGQILNSLLQQVIDNPALNDRNTLLRMVNDGVAS